MQEHELARADREFKERISIPPSPYLIGEEGHGMTTAEIFEVGHKLIGEYTDEILRAEHDIRKTYAEGKHTNVDSARERIKLFEARRGAVTRFLSLITE
jgi:hypothetical protein